MQNLAPVPRQMPSKVIMLGDSAVGKTSIVLQFYKNEFEATSEPTIGAAYVLSELQTSKGPVSIHIWDTAGQERFKSIIPMYMRACAAAILVCAMDSIESVNALDGWLKIVRDNDENLQNIYVALNKIDLEPAFDASMAEKWAKDRGFGFFRTSAKDKKTVDPLFQAVAESLIIRNKQGEMDNVQQPDKPTKGGCCK
jgi:small GTP-binding protein